MTRIRILKATLIFVVSVAFLLAIGGPIVGSVLSKKLKEKLEASNVHIGSMSVNLFTRSITLKDIEWENNTKIKTMYASGIRILPFMREHRISIRRIAVEDGDIEIIQDSTKHSGKQDSISIKGIDVDRITVSDLRIVVKRDSAIQYQATIGLVIHYVALDSMPGLKDLSSYTFKNVETNIKDLQINNPNGLYVFKLKELTFDKELRKLHADSIVLQPVPSKADWGKIVKSQDTRTTLQIGKIDAAGITMAIHQNDTSVMASSVIIDGWAIHAFKNKKYPFTRTKKFPLPMESFRSIGIGVEIDSIKLHKGRVVYEELPTDGFHYSWISFEDLEATVSAVNNREYENLSGYSVLTASAHLMKSGEVKAVFKLPLDKKKRYTAEGAITNVPLKELNTMLKDVAFVEISSGKLNKMLFQFDYDDESSQGQIHFDYEDLKILTLKKDADMEVNSFKTMLVNTAVKNDKTLSGNINVERFKRKAVFNLWTISLMDGIKNAILPSVATKKDVKRDLKREKKK